MNYVLILCVLLVCTIAQIKSTPTLRTSDSELVPNVELNSNELTENEISESKDDSEANVGAADDIVNDNDEVFDSVFDHPGLAWADSIEKLKALGIDTDVVDPSILEDAFLLVPDLIRKHGYPSEAHTVETSDGYLLEMHRIPYSPQASNNGERKIPVLLMHGLLDSSSTWVIMGRYNGMAYLLADLGYDVWLGNSRGNRYGRKHVTLNPDGIRSERREFWNFSWHQIGAIDLPTMIDFILERTGFSKLHYIGHSQGTTSFFVMASVVPEYNEKIIAMQALAPIAWMSRLYSPLIRLMASMLTTLDLATSALGIYEFLPHNELMAYGAHAVCGDDSSLQPICANVIFLLAGYNSAQMNQTMLPVLMGHAPAGSATNNLVHYGQLINNGLFRQFDHGPIRNMIEYGRLNPPPYNTQNIRAPVALHYSLNDWFAHVDDVEVLHQNLPNVIGKFLVADPMFNHVDFVWAIDVVELLYARVFNVMKLAEQGIFSN